MEKEKKKYVKPLLRVAEWDFNEAVCQDWVTQHSAGTICIDVKGGTFDSHYTEIIDNAERWHTWTPTNQN